MNLSNFGMDTITLAGPLEAKLRAVKTAGFTQIMLSARDLVGHPDGFDAAVQAVKLSGLRVSGFQVMRDYEGLTGDLHDYKLEVAKSMLRMASAVGAPLLLVCSSTSSHSRDDVDQIARDLRKLATLALPLGLRIAYEALSWGRHIHEYTQAWEAVARADTENLGIVLDSFHLLASGTPLDGIEDIEPRKLFFVQLSDFMWRTINTPTERMETARHMRVFPGEGVHSEELAALVRQLDRCGYRGDYSFEVFNDDYQQMPLEVVTERARKAAKWVTDRVLRRSLPILQPRKPAAVPLAVAG
ncbi:MAG: sugar phosphate isomerase/epimerase [Betaproteobacteria bacterium]|nr:sugar phosphate isomerase/epimerase [Betaproteobacteria bacterium]MDE2046802.1 sugar phosphate isomerase/epimerase [Betaproteobacteria bacterium]